MTVSKVLHGARPVNARHQPVITEACTLDHLRRAEEKNFIERGLRAKLVDAMKHAKDLTGPSIRDALAATKNYAGVTGNITLDQNRNPLKPAVVLKVGKGGKYEFVTKIYPEGMQPESGSGGDATAGGAKAGSEASNTGQPKK